MYLFYSIISSISESTIFQTQPLSVSRVMKIKLLKGVIACVISNCACDIYGISASLVSGPYFLQRHDTSDTVNQLVNG